MKPWWPTTGELEETCVGATTNALRSWIALDYGGEVEEMLTPVLWTSEDEQEVLSTSEDEQEVKAA